ncbi:MAG TPA: YHS domain-containing protein, partial [Steroidobacteraceae bacterium]|nr:YHS domain-containing protein [Steroidobacteraceae bacterium]
MNETGSQGHIDPVCGMTVAPNPGRAIDQEGTRYYFCSERCQGKFRDNPARYLKAGAAPISATTAASSGLSPAGATYTCPMHPEIRQTGPGTCPKCGMALEPLVVGA